MIVSELLRRLTPRALYLAHKANAHVDDVIATIDIEGLMELRKTARQRTKTLNAIKYFNIHGYMREHMKRALMLELHHPERAVLDIGSGFGYFSYICEFFGNTSIALDVPDHELFNDVTSFLGVSKVFHRIEPFVAMPDFRRKFDLVTASQVAFNRYDSIRPWEAREWTFFLDDLFTNVLNKGGEIYLQMNYDPVHQNWLSPGARRALKKYRARIFGASVRVRKKEGVS